MTSISWLLFFVDVDINKSWLYFQRGDTQPKSEWESWAGQTAQKNYKNCTALCTADSQVCKDKLSIYSRIYKDSKLLMVESQKNIFRCHKQGWPGQKFGYLLDSWQFPSKFCFFYLRNRYCKVILTLLTLGFTVTFALQGQPTISFILFNLLGALAVSSRCVVCNVCIKQNVYTTVSRFVSSLSLLINERATLSHIFYHVYNITLFLIPYIIQTRRICNMYGYPRRDGSPAVYWLQFIHLRLSRTWFRCQKRYSQVFTCIYNPVPCLQ